MATATPRPSPKPRTAKTKPPKLRGAAGIKTVEDIANDPRRVLGTSMPAGIAQFDPDARRAAGKEIETVQLAPSEIEANPWQPRDDFDKPKLAHLNSSMNDDGQLQPIRVRRKPGATHASGVAYQIVDGERRWRAAQLKPFIPFLRAEIVEASDADMACHALIANVERENLNPIEEAEGIRKLAEEHGYTQVEIVKRLGCSQPQVANRLRLLKLPEAWRKRIISGEIPIGQARELVRFAGHPTLLEAIDEEWVGKWSNLRDARSAEDFADHLDSIVNDVTRPMKGGVYISELGMNVNARKFTAEEREALQVVELSEQAQKEERAVNVKLWDELHVDQIAKAKKKRTGGDEDEKTAAKKKKPTAAELAKKQKKQSEQFGRRLEEWRTNWLRYLLSTQIILADDEEKQGVTAALLWLAVNAGHYKENRYKSFEELLRADPHPDRTLLLSPNHSTLAAQFVAHLLWDVDANEPRETFDIDVIDELAAHIQLDLAASWKSEQAGPLTDAFLNLHSKEQLQAMVVELDLKSVCVKRDDMIDQIRHAPRFLQTLPTCLVPEVQEPKTKPAAKKRKAK